MQAGAAGGQIVVAMDGGSEPPTKPLLVVTGGGGDLAGAIRARFLAADWRVEAPRRQEMDVSRAEEVRCWFAAHECPELLVCAAGSTRDRLLARLGEEDWDRVLGDNLSGAAHCARAVGRGMLRRRGGHILFISSHSAIHPPAGQAAYAAAKAGLLGLARSLARELGPAGVRVNTVLPGFLETRMTRDLPAARVEAVRNEHLLGRFNRAAAVAEFLHFLHSRLPDTSGQVFQLDSR